MRRTIMVLALGSLAVVGLPVTHAVAQDTKTARGTVTSMAADSVTVKVQNQNMKFSVDGKTVVEAAGAGTKARQAEAVGKPGPKLGDVLKVGQAVEVSYQDMGGTLHATRIRGVAKVGADPTDLSAERTSSGTVKSVAANSMTITGGGGGGATFTQSFSIDASTKVVGKGAGTAASAKGGKVLVTDLVASGDRVSVSYHAMGNTLLASEIRVTVKAVVAK